MRAAIAVMDIQKKEKFTTLTKGGLMVMTRNEQKNLDDLKKAKANPFSFNGIPPFKCQCGNTFFARVWSLFYVSPLRSGTGQAKSAKMELFACQCGMVYPPTPEVLSQEPEKSPIIGADNGGG